MLLHRALQGIDHFVVLKHARSIRHAPFPGVHKTVVRPVHGFIHPPVFAHMNVDGHSQLGALRQNRVHARIVYVHAGGPLKTPALVAQLAHAAGAGPCAALEFRDRTLGKPA